MCSSSERLRFPVITPTLMVSLPDHRDVGHTLRFIGNVVIIGVKVSWFLPEVSEEAHVLIFYFLTLTKNLQLKTVDKKRH